MNMVSMPAALMAAVCFYVGFYYLWMYLRRRSDSTSCAFALTCFAIALYDVFSACLYSASSLSQGMFWQRLQFAALSLFSITVSWFIYYFTGHRSRRPFIALSIWMFLLFVLGLAVRGEMTLSLSSPRIKNVRIADLINITYYEVDPGIIYTIQYVSMAAVTVFMLFIIVRFAMSGEKRYAVPLLACMGLFSAAALNDTLVGAGLYRFIFLVEYAYMVIIVFMANVLLSQFMDLHREVTELNVRLEDKVNERTMELFFSEIGSRMYYEMMSSLHNGDSSMGTSMMRYMEKEGPSKLAELSRDTSIISNLDLLLSRVVSQAVETTGADAGFLFIINREGGPELKASAGTPGNGNSGDRSLTVTGVMATGEILIRPEPDQAAGTAAGALLCLPITVQASPVGALCLEKNGQGLAFTEKDGGMMAAFLEHVAVAVENARLYRRIREEVKGSAGRPSMSVVTEEKIRRALSYIHDNYTSDISREGLAASLDMHPDSLGRYFKMYTGRKINDYINELRVRDAAGRISESDNTIISIAFQVGFESLATFNRSFLRIMGVNPGRYREISREGQ